MTIEETMLLEIIMTFRHQLFKIRFRVFRLLLNSDGIFDIVGLVFNALNGGKTADELKRKGFWASIFGEND